MRDYLLAWFFWNVGLAAVAGVCYLVYLAGLGANVDPGWAVGGAIAFYIVFGIPFYMVHGD